MSKRAKANGSRYEREFVALMDDNGLPAHRVPLSGAMEGYKDDVVVCDEIRVECKFRRDGAGFSRLHDWMPEPGKVLRLAASGLIVWRLADWAAHVRGELEAPPSVERDVTAQKTLLAWMGEADVLALRRRRHPWLVCTKEVE